MSATQGLTQQKEPVLESSTLEHADKLLAIRFTMDKYLIYEYCHAYTGRTSGEAHLAPQTVGDFGGKKVRGEGVTKEECLTGYFVNATGKETRSKGDSSFPPNTHIYSIQMLKRRLEKVDEALSKLNPNQFKWVEVRYLSWPESIKSICDSHNINYEVIRKPLFRAKTLAAYAICN